MSLKHNRRITQIQGNGWFRSLLLSNQKGKVGHFQVIREHKRVTILRLIILFDMAGIKLINLVMWLNRQISKLLTFYMYMYINILVFAH